MTFNFAEYKNLLAASESTNNYNTNTGNGAYGAYQFLENTIDWIAGIIGIQTPSIQTFLGDPNLQDQFLETYVKQSINFINNNNLNRYIDSTVKGKGNNIVTTINLYGLIAGAHLGGNGNLKRFLVDNIDASDQTNKTTGGTFVSDYVAKFSKLFNEKKKTNNNIGNISTLDIKKIIDDLTTANNFIKNVLTEIKSLEN